MDRHGILILNKWNIYIYLIWGSCNLSHAFLGWANMFGNLTSVEMETCPDGPNVADVAMVQLTQKWFRGHQNGYGLEPWRGFAGRTSNFYQGLTSRLDQLIVLYSLVGGWPTPLKNISQLWILFPIYGKIKNVPDHQPVYSMFPIITRLYPHILFAEFHIRTETKSISTPPKKTDLNVHSRIFTFHIFLDLAGYTVAPYVYIYICIYVIYNISTTALH